MMIPAMLGRRAQCAKCRDFFVVKDSASQHPGGSSGDSFDQGDELPDLPSDETKLGEVRASMSVGSDPGGGYSVYPAISDGMTKKLWDQSPMRRIARVVPITTGTDLQFAAPARTADIDFGRGLGEWEIARPEAHRKVSDIEKGAAELDQAALQMTHMARPVDH